MPRPWASCATEMVGFCSNRPLRSIAREQECGLRFSCLHSYSLGLAIYFLKNNSTGSWRGCGESQSEVTVKLPAELDVQSVNLRRSALQELSRGLGWCLAPGPGPRRPGTPAPLPAPGAAEAAGASGLEPWCGSGGRCPLCSNVPARF